MALDLSPGALVNAASSVPLILLGLWVSSLKPRTRTTTALAVYSVTFGSTWILDNLFLPGDALWSLPAVVLLFAALPTAAAFALPIAGLGFPRPLPPDRRGVLLVAGAVAALPSVGVALNLAARPVQDSFPPALGSPPQVHVLFAAVAVGLGLLFSAAMFVVVLAGMRYRESAQAEGSQAGLTLVATALGLFPGLFAGDHLDLRELQPLALFTLLALVAAAAVWLREAHRTTGPDARRARNTALALLAAPLAGAVIHASLPGAFTTAGGPELGLSRMLGVLLLTFAILRHRVLGIDVKAKWTVKQSTIAAAFVGVFFVASEGAQQVFSSAAGPYVGIAAAGMLVFALAPLQHAAERVANAAVPGVGSRERMSAEERRTAYAEAAQLLWKDGVLTVKERHALDGLRDRLGLSGEEARTIERGVTEAKERDGASLPQRQR